MINRLINLISPIKTYDKLTLSPSLVVVKCSISHCTRLMDNIIILFELTYQISGLVPSSGECCRIVAVTDRKAIVHECRAEIYYALGEL